MSNETKMVHNKISNIFCEAIVRTYGGCMLDANKVLWKLIDGKWIGKRSVWTFDFRACWLEETTIDNVKSWWCGGKDADYTEIFYREDTKILKNSNKKTEKKFVVKDFEDQVYYCGESYGWSQDPFLAEYFETFEDAENFIKGEDGRFQIETVYVV